MKYPPHPLTRKQANSLIDAARRSRCGLRDAAHLTVLYRTGIRCSESCNMDMADIRDIDGNAMVLRVSRPKGWESGAMPREIGLDKQGTNTLRLWLAERERLIGASQKDWDAQCSNQPPTPVAGPVFMTLRGGVCGRVSPSHIRRLVSMLGRQAGIGRRVHPHAFRHTFARELYDEGVGIVEIMLALGHTSLTTTQKYLRSIGATEVVNITAQRGSW